MLRNGGVASEVRRPGNENTMDGIMKATSYSIAMLCAAALAIGPISLADSASQVGRESLAQASSPGALDTSPQDSDAESKRKKRTENARKQARADKKQGRIEDARKQDTAEKKKQGRIQDARKQDTAGKKQDRIENARKQNTDERAAAQGKDRATEAERKRASNAKRAKALQKERGQGNASRRAKGQEGARAAEAQAQNAKRIEGARIQNTERRKAGRVEDARLKDTAARVEARASLAKLDEQGRGVAKRYLLEQNKHNQRIARLKRIEELYAARGDRAALERIDHLRDKELLRFQAFTKNARKALSEDQVGAIEEIGRGGNRRRISSEAKGVRGSEKPVSKGAQKRADAGGKR